MKTAFSDIEDFPGWCVTSDGNVINEYTGRSMAVNFNQQGICLVKLTLEKKQYTRSLALIVARAFVPTPAISSWTSVIHLNGDRSDCREMNLMWRTREYALRYHSMFNEEPRRLGVWVPELGRGYSSLREFCTTYGIYETSAYMDLFNGDPCDFYGYKLERLEE